MTPLVLLLLLRQGAVPTVGDTVYLEHALGSTGTAVVRPQPWSLGELGQQLGPAEVRVGAGGAVMRYAVVFWYPGTHALSMPGAVLVRRDGSSDTLAATAMKVEVASVLPAGARRSTLAPRGASGLLPLGSRSLRPALLLGGAVLLGLGLLAALRRRRGPSPPAPAAPEPGVTPAVLARWALAGEYRAALGGWTPLLVRRLEASRDPVEAGKLQRLLGEVSSSGFTGDDPARLAALCERAAKAAGP
jgi:hypothetical protein